MHHEGDSPEKPPLTEGPVAPDRGILWLALYLLALPTLYILTITPLMCCLISLKPPLAGEPLVELFFAPYVWLGEHTPLTPFLQTYHRWWLEVFGFVP